MINRIAPAGPGVPAEAFVTWDKDYSTWEKLADLIPA